MTILVIISARSGQHQNMGKPSEPNDGAPDTIRQGQLDGPPPRSSRIRMCFCGACSGCFGVKELWLPLAETLTTVALGETWAASLVDASAPPPA